MAVYTRLDEGFLRALVSVYDDEAELLSFEGIAAGSSNTTYKLTTDRGVFFLRVNEHKHTDDVFYERDLLVQLAAANLGDVDVPRLMKTRIGGWFYLIDRRGDRPIWGGLFEELPGRQLGVFEVLPAHVEQIGAFMARAHRALKKVRGRANPYGISTIQRWLDAIVRVPALADVGLRLQRVLDDIKRRRRRLPRGTIHGDLFIDNTKWRSDRLQSVFDWEMAGKDHLLLDIAVALCAWCWRRDGAGGAFDVELCRALLSGYQRVRRLHDSERRGLFIEMRLAALRFTASRLFDFEVPRPECAGAERLHLDYRDFLARLDVVEQLGQRGVARWLL